MIRSTEITDTYGAGQYLRRWSLVDGHARCIDDAYTVAETDAATIAAQISANAEVRATLTAVEAYEAALAIAGQDEPAQTIEGDDGFVPNPAWQTWSDAVGAVAGADPATIALADLRAGRVVPEPEA